MIQDSEMAVKKMSKPRRLKYSTWLGRIAERVAKEELKKRGYKFGDIGAHGRRTGIEIWECKECKPVGEQIHQCPYGRTVEKCPFGEKWFKLAKYAQGVMAHVQVERTARTNGVFWDLHATKNGQDYIIEVKAGSGRLSKEQKNVLNYAKELGYKVLIVKVRVDLILKDLQIEEYVAHKK